MSNKKQSDEKWAGYGAKLALTAGSISSLYLLPIAAQGTVIHRTGNISLNLNTAAGGAHAYWDVDGNSTTAVGAEFALLRGDAKGTAGSNVGRRLFITSNNGLNGRGFVRKAAEATVQGGNTVQLTGNSFYPLRKVGRMAALPNGFVVGPSLTAGFVWGQGQYTVASMPLYRGLLVKNPNPSTVAAINNYAVLGGFQPGNNVFGFRFKSGSDMLYGWGILNLSLGGDSQGASATITEWQYDTVSGNVSPTVPEPSTPSLALIGLGAAGVRMWRARKKLQAEAVDG